MDDENQKGVVDDELRVHGVKKLRIADNSAFPHIPACHLQAPTAPNYVSQLYITGYRIPTLLNPYLSPKFADNLLSLGAVQDPTASVGRVSEKDGRGISFTSRLKSLFWIATTNVIFPLIFSLMQIIIVFTSDNILLAASIAMANIYVAIISTAFATIWAATSSFKEAHKSIYRDSREMGSTTRAGEMRIESIVFSSVTSTNRSEPTSDPEDRVTVKAWGTAR
ncbi:hypothetical protein D9758_007501 [Tetrapyrgos nigripes]|uniref:Glucose-methanol-choline oxidoreductase C-terminal domain-containing protein n=1 Tax=Tetrapyrgos nigripes TaxID=182062 RepID=A0A8H5G3D8_9AGAR|nr:hypothetical protein D9758_007501 [Tetrapyrgos nigripes]